MSLITTEMLQTHYGPKITMSMSAYAKAIVDTQKETIDRVLVIIDKKVNKQKAELENDIDAPNYLDADWRKAAIDGMEIIRAAVQALKGGEE